MHAITLSTYTPSTNTFQINSGYDFMLMYNILEDLNKKVPDKNFDITVFLTKCDKYSISNMLNLKELGVNNIFLGNCSPLSINPLIIESLKDIYNIKTLSTPREDLDKIRSL